MRIQHNISAMNSYRQIGNNNNALAKNLEKLSSGFKINRAGDDAAGLAISEKMRAQVKGLETAQKNAQDGISLVQTAEGALTEVHSMLNRMVELATQSSNGTYSDEVDRENLQKEVQSLLSEVDRISESTNFNGINLLDGSLGGAKNAPKVSGKLAGNNITMTQVAAKGGKFTGANAVGAGTNGTAKSYEISYKDADDKEHTVKVDYTEGANQAATNAALKKALEENKEISDLFSVAVDGNNKVILTTKEKGSLSPIVTKIGGANATQPGANGADKAVDAGFEVVGGAIADGDFLVVDGKRYEKGAATDAENGVYATEAEILAALRADGYKVVKANDPKDDAVSFANDFIITKDPKVTKGLELQIGDTADSFNKLTVNVGKMDSKALGIADIDISTAKGADAAIKLIKDAINQVSTTRGDLGAAQNRLEHTINNLGVTTENITAAESRIRDTDMANEMMAYTKNNILVQASQAMLAQANQVPQGVLQLLQ